MNELEKKIFGDLGAWIEKHISVKQAGADKDSKDINKADLLEHILERYRLQQKRLDNSISFEDAINWECYADEEQLVLSSPDKPAPTLSKGTGPYYQPSLYPHAGRRYTSNINNLLWRKVNPFWPTNNHV